MEVNPIPLASMAVRIVIARCSVDYQGRLSAHLPEAVRMLMVKADGCIAIHSDGGAFKPLNWMNAPNQFLEVDGRWEVSNPRGEHLTVTITEVLSDSSHELGADPGLTKDGVERHLQELLAANPWVLEQGLTLVRREYPTDLGPIDLVCLDRDGGMVAIEVKRRGEIAGVEQLARYHERLTLDGRMGPVRGMLVAQTIASQARFHAQARGFEAIEVDYEGLRAAESREMRLF